MKIGIEAQRIFRKKKHGMDLVAVQLIRNLQQIDTKNEYFIFVKDDEDNTVIRETSNFHVIKIKRAPYPYWEQVLLPQEAKKYGIQVLHCTSNTAPLNTDVPLLITLHDIIYLEKLNFTKGTWYQILGNLYRRWNVPLAVKKSACLLTVSDYERERILSHFNLSPHKIKTVYNGVSEIFKAVKNESVLQAIKHKYKLPDQFVFYLGNTDPKKNMEGVMRALAVLRKRNQLNFKLLMLDIDRAFLHKMAAKIGDTGVLNYIVCCGYVPNHELPAIYSIARLFLYPSLRESFGIPILESMACGTPVITSNTSSMPEVAGKAAFLVNPFDPEDIASGIMKVLNNERLQHALVQKGLARSACFSWKNNAIETLHLYETLTEQQLSPVSVVNL